MLGDGVWLAKGVVFELLTTVTLPRLSVQALPASIPHLLDLYHSTCPPLQPISIHNRSAHQITDTIPLAMSSPVLTDSLGLLLRRAEGAEQAAPACKSANSFDGGLGLRVSALFVILITSSFSSFTRPAARYQC